jgi:hypothetical protein
VATWDSVHRLAGAFPEVEAAGYGSQRAWRVGGKLFAWERPLRKADLAELGPAAPAGPILGVRVPDEGVKLALVADDPGVYLTTSHFDGYPAVLVQLEHIDDAELAELLEEAWLARAPTRLRARYLADRGPTVSPDVD